MPQLREEPWECTVRFHFYDFNVMPMNGELPRDIRKKFQVDVTYLGQIEYLDGVRPLHQLIVDGNTDTVGPYLVHLKSTWPQQA